MSKVISFKNKNKEINFKVFARNVAEGKDDEAEKITLHFKKKYEESPNVMMQMMMIKTQLEQGSQNNALMVIQDLLNQRPLIFCKDFSIRFFVE